MPSFWSRLVCDFKSGGALLKTAPSKPRLTTDTFDSGKPYKLTRSLLEHSESVMIARENFADHHTTRRCSNLTRREWEGICKSVTSWIVHTTGMLPVGTVLGAGANI